jgi:hypothetical protein
MNEFLRTIPDEDEQRISSSLKKPSNQATQRFIPLVDWPKYHPWPPIGGLRHLVFHSASNGFRRVYKKCGRRILIDEQKFFEFLEQKNQENPKKKGNA